MRTEPRPGSGIGRSTSSRGPPARETWMARILGMAGTPRAGRGDKSPLLDASDEVRIPGYSSVSCIPHRHTACLGLGNQFHFARNESAANHLKLAGPCDTTIQSREVSLCDLLVLFCFHL